MNRSDLPETGFIDPSGANAEAVRDLAEDALTQTLGQLEAADSRSPLSEESIIPSAAIPTVSRPENELLDDLGTVVAGSMNPAHPGYIGHMDTMPTEIHLSIFSSG